MPAINPSHFHGVGCGSPGRTLHPEVVVVVAGEAPFGSDVVDVVLGPGWQ